MPSRREARTPSPRIFSKIAVATTMSTLFFAQSSFGKDDREATARAALLARFDAALHADLPALERLLAEDLEYCGVSATCSTKAQYLESVRSGTRKFRSLRPEIEHVRLFSDSAVLTGKVYSVSIVDGVEKNVDAYFLVVLAWRDGRWQMTNQSSTSLEPRSN
jgi:hypothetical protein